MNELPAAQWKKGRSLHCWIVDAAGLELLVDVTDTRVPKSKMRWTVRKAAAMGKGQQLDWLGVLDKVETRCVKINCVLGDAPKTGFWPPTTKPKSAVDLFDGKVVFIKDRHWFTFGKYGIGQDRSLSVQDVALQDPKYLAWLDGQDFSNDFKRGLKAIIKMVQRGKWKGDPAPKLEVLPTRKHWKKAPPGGPLY